MISSSCAASFTSSSVMTIVPSGSASALAPTPAPWRKTISCRAFTLSGATSLSNAWRNSCCRAAGSFVGRKAARSRNCSVLPPNRSSIFSGTLKAIHSDSAGRPQ
ncbi:hypothetical protein D3C83_01850 [compost metagenome]